jgi:selenocysteine lyase/cysteine desulfurase
VPDAEATLRRLRRAGIRAAGRAGAVRLSFHLYNDATDVDRALEALAAETLVP